MSIFAIATALVLVALNGLFVAAEFSMVASQRPKLELLAGTGSRRAIVALAVMRDLPRNLAGSQLGITVCSLGLGVLGEPAVADAIRPGLEEIGTPSGLAHGIAFGLALAIVVTLHMVFGEMVPKGVALAGPERTLLLLAPVSAAITGLFRPLIWFLDRSSTLIVRSFGLTPKHELASSVTAAELAPMIDASHDEGLLESFEHSLLAGALDFRRRPVSAVMVPRERVVYVNRRMSVAAIERVAHQTGHSRLPVVGAGIDDVTGFLHIKDLLALPADARDQPLPAALIRRLQILPHDRPLEDVLRAMRRARSHLGVVRGPGGRTVGVVTLEDVLEAFVGDIRDESDRDPTPERRPDR
jgi:CBS domain containing-hemolysin-like protein